MTSLPNRFAALLAAAAGDRLRFSGGTRATAFNAYVPGDKKRLLVGVYRDGRVWTNCAAIGPEASERLASALGSVGIELDTAKEWCFWKQADERFYLSESDLERIA